MHEARRLAPRRLAGSDTLSAVTPRGRFRFPANVTAETTPGSALHERVEEIADEDDARAHDGDERGEELWLEDARKLELHAGDLSPCGALGRRRRGHRGIHPRLRPRRCPGPLCRQGQPLGRPRGSAPWNSPLFECGRCHSYRPSSAGKRPAARNGADVHDGSNRTVPARVTHSARSRGSVQARRHRAPRRREA